MSLNHSLSPPAHSRLSRDKIITLLCVNLVQAVAHTSFISKDTIRDMWHFDEIILQYIGSYLWYFVIHDTR